MDRQTLCIDWYHVKAGPVNPKQRSRGRGNNGGNPNRGNFSNGGNGGGGGGSRHINIRTQVFDSNGPEGRIRGNAHQVMEKYLALARDASSQGDRVAAENFYQHAEHYFRLINAYNQNNGQRRPQNLPTPAEDQADLTGDDIEGEEQQAAEAAPTPEAVEAPAQPAEQPQAEATENAEPRPQRAERQSRGERQPRGERASRGERGERAERTERAERSEARAETAEPRAEGEAQAQRPEGEARPERAERAPRRRSRQAAAQPAAETDEGGSAEAVGA